MILWAMISFGSFMCIKCSIFLSACGPLDGLEGVSQSCSLEFSGQSKV